MPVKKKRSNAQKAIRGVPGTRNVLGSTRRALTYISSPGGSRSLSLEYYHLVVRTTAASLADLPLTFDRTAILRGTISRNEAVASRVSRPKSERYPSGKNTYSLSGRLARNFRCDDSKGFNPRKSESRAITTIKTGGRSMRTRARAPGTHVRYA